MIAADLVTALSSALGGRLYRIEAPPKAARPYGVYEFDDAEPTTDFAGEASLTNHQMQLEIYDGDPVSLASLALTIRATMATASSFKSICKGQRDIFDFELSLPGVRMLFSIWQ